MSNLKQIKKRLWSVKNTQQITRAMKMIAAVKLRRIQHLVQDCRPFSGQVLEMIQPLFGSVMDPVELSPFLRKEDFFGPARIRLLVIASDKGLCGSYNSNVLRVAERLFHDLEGQGREVIVDAIGKRAADYFRKRVKEKLGTFHEAIGRQFSRSLAIGLMKSYREQYLAGDFDALYVVYSEFVSTMVQKPRSTTVLPIHPYMIRMESSHHAAPDAERKGERVFPPSLIEPSELVVAQYLVEAFLDSRFYQLLLDSIASEHGARMMAMENANRNSSEMILDLTREYNQERQAEITDELLDIIGGAEALA